MTFRLALAQLESAADSTENLQKAERSMHQAADLGAEITLFPEMFMNHFAPGTPLQVLAQHSEPVDGPFVHGMQELARSTGSWCVFGMRERSEDPSGRAFNTTLVLDGDGRTVAAYRKTHLYDAFGYRESDAIMPGDALFEPIVTPFGRIGLFVCYELRFPEVAREQVARGAEVLLVPAAWARGPMKEYHFEHFVVTRALENTVFLAACGECGAACCGRSIVADPMGVPLGSGPEDEALILADIDLHRIAEVRRKLPAYAQRRPQIYTHLHAENLAHTQEGGA